MPPDRPSRRTLLRGALGIGGLLVLGGCSGERIRTPWSPTPTVDVDDPQTWPPDTDLLLAARERLHAYRTVLTSVNPENGSEERRARAVGRLWDVQQDRVEQILELSGLHLDDLGEVRSPGPAEDAAATTGAGGPDLTGLGTRVREELTGVVEELTRSTPTNRAMLISLAAQHADAAALFGAEVDWPPLAGPRGTAAVPVIAVTRPAVFGLEVVAARSVGEERELYESVLRPVQSVSRQLTTLAEDAAPVPPLGYDLPEPLDEEQRRELARALVLDIPPAVLSVADRAGSDAEQLGSWLRLVATATMWLRMLEVPVVPFPGMTLP